MNLLLEIVGLLILYYVVCAALIVVIIFISLWFIIDVILPLFKTSD